MALRKFTDQEAKAIGDSIGVDWSRYSLDQFRMGLDTEMEHADVTGGEPTTTGRIALAHLNEMPDYYTRLKRMESGNMDGLGSPADARRSNEQVAREVAQEIIDNSQSSWYDYHEKFDDEEMARMVQNELKERGYDSSVTPEVDGEWNLELGQPLPRPDLDQAYEEEFGEEVTPARERANRRNWKFARRDKKSGQFKRKKGWFGESMRHRLARLKGRK